MPEGSRRLPARGRCMIELRAVGASTTEILISEPHRDVAWLTRHQVGGGERRTVKILAELPTAVIVVPETEKL